MATKKAKKKQKSAAVVTIIDAARMTKRGKRDVADWLRHHAAMLETDGANYSRRFTGRYLYA